MGNISEHPSACQKWKFYTENIVDLFFFYRPKWKPVTGDIAEHYSIGKNKNLTREIFLIIFRQAKMKIVLITLYQARIKTGHDNVWKARTES